MKPSDEIIEKFQRIYHEEFGEEVSREKAYEMFEVGQPVKSHPWATYTKESGYEKP